ncbi:MAG: hypothetical protein AABZ12_06920 [Planctomycetota bacterium]
MGLLKPRPRTNPRGVLPVILVLAGFMIVTNDKASVALVRTQDGCTWPGDWPKALDQVQNSCRTIEWMAGIQENIYEIVFDDREKFEKLWPILLMVKSPGAPLRLFKAEILPDLPERVLTSNARPAVRIFAPAYDGIAMFPGVAGEREDIDRLLEEGKALRSSPPWPAGIVSANGELPEYVQAPEEEGRLKWVPADRDYIDRGFLFRARVELELVVDGSVIDLNRTELPSNGPMIDRRFQPKP